MFNVFVEPAPTVERIIVTCCASNSKDPTTLKLALWKNPVTAAVRFLRGRARSLKASLSDPSKHLLTKPPVYPADKGFCLEYRVFKVQMSEPYFKAHLKSGTLERQEGHYLACIDFMRSSPNVLELSKMLLEATSVVCPGRAVSIEEPPLAPTWDFYIPLGANAKERVATSPHSWIEASNFDGVWKLMKKYLGCNKHAS